MNLASLTQQDKIVLVKADITTISADAIVNAANCSLLGGGGVDGAIHKAAGPELFQYCKQLNGCATGEVKHSPAFKLNARYIFHAVGPVWQGGIKNEHHILAQTYQNCFNLANQLRVQSMAFPAISTGVYRFPKPDAAEIAIKQTLKAFQTESVLSKVFFVIFDDENFHYYSKLMGRTF
jgi:O-acetyl-ADP-ribose deacetylase